MSASRVTRSSTRAQRNATAARQADVAAEPKPEAPTCGVCFDAIKCQGRLDVCKHAFCYDCRFTSLVFGGLCCRDGVVVDTSPSPGVRPAGIKEWSAESNTCPLCQARFHKLTKHDVRIPAAGGATAPLN